MGVAAATAMVGQQKAKSRYETGSSASPSPPVMKVKAWSPSELSENDEEPTRSNEVEDSLQYSGGSPHGGERRGVAHFLHPHASDEDEGEGEEVDEDENDYSADNYSDEEQETQRQQPHRLQSQSQLPSQPSQRTLLQGKEVSQQESRGGNGKKVIQQSEAMAIYPEISSKPTKKMSGEPLDLHSSSSAPALHPTTSTPPSIKKQIRHVRYPSSSAGHDQQQQTKIPPLVPPHLSQHDPHAHHGHHGHGHGSGHSSGQAQGQAKRRAFASQSSSGSVEEGSSSGRTRQPKEDSKVKQRQPKALSSLDPAALSSQRTREASQLSKSSVHPLIEEKKREQQQHPSSIRTSTRASSASAAAAVGKPKWRCTNKNCVHINYAEDNYCSNCGSVKSAPPGMKKY
jgi:hypothetical protein